MRGVEPNIMQTAQTEPGVRRRSLEASRLSGSELKLSMTLKLSLRACNAQEQLVRAVHDREHDSQQLGQILPGVPA